MGKQSATELYLIEKGPSLSDVCSQVTGRQPGKGMLTRILQEILILSRRKMRIKCTKFRTYFLCFLLHILQRNLLPQWARGSKASVLPETKQVPSGPGWDPRVLGLQRRNAHLSSSPHLQGVQLKVFVDVF